MPETDARVALYDCIQSTLHSFGREEGNAIMNEVMSRMESGARFRDWIAMIDLVTMERHPYLRLAREKMN